MRTNDSYLMTTVSSCGPDALSYVLAKQFPAQDPGYAEITRLWDWPNTQDWRDNARDFIGAHFRVLDLLRICHRVVTFSEITAGKLPSDSIVVLLHDYPHRKCQSSSDPFLFQHWVVVSSVDADRAVIHFHDGRGGIVSYPLTDFAFWYSSGAPNCAYTVADGALYACPMERLWDRFAMAVIAAYTWIMGK